MDAVRAAIDRALARLPGGRWVVACSGGPDSTALVDALAVAGGRALTVVAVDHGLREAAAAEAAAVVAWAQSRGLDAESVRVVVAGKSMAAARRARYDALVAAAGRAGAGVIAVGHTASDQAETLLDRLIRGAGTRGLSAMAPARRIASTGADLWLVRPLLSVPRADVEAYLAARGLTVVRDPTNEDRAYRRSRLRHDVLPLLQRERPDLDRALAATCDRLRADADALDTLAADAARRLTGPDGSLDALALAALPEALFARVVATHSGLVLGAVHVAAVARLCATTNGTRSLDLPAGIVAERRYGRLTFARRSENRAPAVTGEVAVARPGIYLLNQMQVEVTPELFDSLGPAGAEPLVLRHVRAGDRARLGKVQDLLVNAKVPRPERARLPVLARGARVLWIPGFGVQ
jgi:tRNA(Ile)-lysidine synthetase-like protein